MKIVTRLEFLAMPGGTVYSKYEPYLFGNMQIKGETITHEGSSIDFFTQPLCDAVACEGPDDMFDILNLACTRNSFSMDFNCEGRDGLFEEGQLFAVWENEDVRALVERLNNSILCRLK